MELKLPPIVAFLLFGGLMYGLAALLPIGEFDFFGRAYLLYILTGLGVLILLVAFSQFFRSKTTIDPKNPEKASNLITHGIFAVSRNPIYLSMLLFLLAFGLKWENVFNVLLAAGFVAYMNRFQIIPEERALLVLFGQEYQQYCLKVRRWF